MKKKWAVVFLVLISLFLGVNNCYAKNNLSFMECEYTDEFKEYMKLSDEKKKQTIMPFMCKISGVNLVESNVSSMGSTNVSKFDLRTIGKVTSVKNQENTNSCWAFATNSSLESNLLVNNYGEYDLSESHMELSTQNTFELNRTSFNRRIGSGGNYLISSAYLLNHRGPIFESKLGFNDFKNLFDENANLKNNVSFDVSNVDKYKNDIETDEVVLLSNESGTCGDLDSINEIKKYLVNYGAIASNLYWDTNFLSYNVVQSEKKITLGSYYYYDGTESQSVNHGVTIVGWDDNVSRDNFSSLSGKKPTIDGAWIIKNSWGSQADSYTSDDGIILIDTKGDSGYYYVSYQDYHVCDLLSGFKATNSVLDNAYYYDELGFNSIIQYNKSLGGIYAATKYHKKTNDKENIKKIVFASPGADMNYEIYYSDNGGLKNPKKIGEGVTSHMGYVSYKPNSDIIINTDEYSIIVKYDVYQNSSIEIPISIGLLDAAYYQNNKIISDANYISNSLDGPWIDTASSKQPFNLSIKVYTNNVLSNSQHQPGDSENNIPDSEENRVDEGGSIEVVENPKNEQSYISSQNQIANPSTSYDNLIVPIIFSIICIVVILLAIKKISKKGVYYEK